MASLSPDQSAIERHVLYILLDSNLPTGGFVASSGLESYAKHGFFSAFHLASLSSSKDGRAARPGTTTTTTVEIQEAVVAFAKSSVMNYAKSTLAFVKDAWTLLDHLYSANPGENSTENSVDTLVKLDNLYEAMTLNHVTRRSSTAQGIALLTLLTKGFAPPNPSSGLDRPTSEGRELWWKSSVDTYKRLIRRGEAHGHLPVCWGVLTRAMGLSLERSLHLHLFLHVRSLLSSAVRLNLIGPYASTQLLLHSLQGCIELEAGRNLGATTGVKMPDFSLPGSGRGEDEDDEAGDEAEIKPDSVTGSTKAGIELGDWDWSADVPSAPAVTWPLGELLMCRHDMQHTRIFNS